MTRVPRVLRTEHAPGSYTYAFHDVLFDENGIPTAKSMTPLTAPSVQAVSDLDTFIVQLIYATKMPLDFITLEPIDG